MLRAFMCTRFYTEFTKRIGARCAYVVIDALMENLRTQIMELCVHMILQVVYKLYAKIDTFAPIT